MSKYDWIAIKNIGRYIRWTILQRIFWKAQAHNKLWIANYIRTHWYRALHDKP